MAACSLVTLPIVQLVRTIPPSVFGLDVLQRWVWEWALVHARPVSKKETLALS